MRIMDAPPEPITSLRARRAIHSFCVDGWIASALLAMTAESYPGDAHAQPNFLNQINAILPVSPPRKKYFALARARNSFTFDF
jgi:hypothetical protein